MTILATSSDAHCAFARAAFLSLVLIACPVAAAGAADSPFAALPGSWAGTGTIAMSNGTKERIRCQATYRLENPAYLRLEMGCASDSYRFELHSQITYDDQSVSGSWNETTRGVGGNLTGRASGERIQARAEGQTFTALLDMRTRGNQQSVSIQSPGSEMSEVTIVLTRGARSR